MKHLLSSRILLVSVSLFCVPMLSLCLLLCLPLMFLCAVALYTNAWAMYFYCCRWTSLWKELLCGLPLHPSAVIQWNSKLLRAIPFVLSKSDPHVCRLDVYSSINARSSGVLVLFVYGSATPQSKRLYAPMASRLRDLGYIVVVPQYRQECACYDIREAIKYATKIVPSEMIYILGHGTAADVATQIVFEDVLAKVKCLAEQDKGKHSLSLQQPLDFLPQIEGLLLFAGCYSESIAGMIHAHHALFKMSNDLLDLFPRILFVHGNKDSTVPVQESIDMYNMLGEALPPERRQDVDVRMRLYKSLSHVQCIQSLYKDIKDFIGDTLQ